MRDCFGAGAGCVYVSAGRGREDCEGAGGEAFGGEVYVCAGDGGGGDEEEWLS